MGIDAVQTQLPKLNLRKRNLIDAMHCLTVLLPFSAWVIKSLNFRKNTFDMVWLPVVVNDCNNMMVPRWFCIYYIIFSE